VKYLDDVRYDVFTNNPKKYEVYMFKQLIELIETYKPDGMWIDWFMWNIESSAHMIMEFMKKRYPNTVLTFNNSVHSRLKWAHYTSYEAHDINTAWKRGNKYRNKMRPWELVGPAASDWDNPRPRADPYEAARIAVIIMASGGKFAFGMPSQMNGDLYEQPSKQLEVFGKWYKKRKEVFTEAVPMQYKGKKVPGVKVSDKSIGIIGSIFKKDNILHLIYRYSVKKKDLLVEFSHKKWENIDKIFLVPSERELKLRKFEKKLELTLPKEYVDRIDTILKIKMK
jgi:alpha-L-fucosidase